MILVYHLIRLKTRDIPKQLEELVFRLRQNPGDQRSGVWTNFGLRGRARQNQI